MQAIGCDLCEVERLRKALQRHPSRLLSRLFTPKEQAYCGRFSDPIPHLAARFAAKEALSKALGTGIGKHLNWLDIEIENDPSGKPHITLSPKARAHFANPRIHLSLSHTPTVAMAVALVE